MLITPLKETSIAMESSKQEDRKEVFKSVQVKMEADEDEMERENEEEEEEEEAEHEQLGQLLGKIKEEVEKNETRMNTTGKDFDITLMCRNIRIGSFKIHCQNNSVPLHVNINSEEFSFDIPTVNNTTEIVNIRLKAKDIVHTLGHFGRCLPVLFIYTNSCTGGIIRSLLHMNKSDGIYFDPSEADEKQKRIIFSIESITDEHRVFLQHIFPGDSLLQKIDLKTANEILIRSTPTKPPTSKCLQVMLQDSVPYAFPQNPAQVKLETDEDEMERETEEEEEEEEEDVEEKHEQLGQLLVKIEEEVEKNETRMNTTGKDFDITLLCRNIRIGSFKIHSQNNSCPLHVNVNSKEFSFDIPTVNNATEIVNIRLKGKDIVYTVGHFGRYLPVLFIYTNSCTGGIIRSLLHMNNSDGIYFDPSGPDEKQKRIIFSIESITDEHRVFLQHIFPGDSLLQEIDLKTANEILIRSTPTKPLVCNMPFGTIRVTGDNVKTEFDPAQQQSSNPTWRRRSSTRRRRAYSPHRRWSPKRKQHRTT